MFYNFCISVIYITEPVNWSTSDGEGWYYTGKKVYVTYDISFIFIGYNQQIFTLYIRHDELIHVWMVKSLLQIAIVWNRFPYKLRILTIPFIRKDDDDVIDKPTCALTGTKLISVHRVIIEMYFKS